MGMPDEFNCFSMDCFQKGVERNSSDWIAPEVNKMVLLPVLVLLSEVERIVSRCRAKVVGCCGLFLVVLIFCVSRGENNEQIKI